MKDLEMLKRFGSEDLAPRRAEEIPAAMRNRLIREIAKPLNGKSWRPWTNWIAAIATGFIAIVAVAVTLQSAASTSNDSLSGAEPSAVHILQQAALAASNSNRTVPRSDQYIYTEVLATVRSQFEMPNSAVKTTAGELSLTQTWRSVDGLRAGLLRTRPHDAAATLADEWAIPGCSSEGRTAGVNQSEMPQARQIEQRRECKPGFDASIPATTENMRAWLRDRVKTAGNVPQPRRSSGANADPESRRIFEFVGDLLVGGTYITSQQRSALFNSLTQIRGVSVIGNMKDVVGREGVAVGASEDAVLIFDAESFAFLGTTTTAIMRQEVVDRIGQVP